MVQMVDFYTHTHTQSKWVMTLGVKWTSRSAVTSQLSTQDFELDGQHGTLQTSLFGLKCFCSTFMGLFLKKINRDTQFRDMQSVPGERWKMQCQSSDQSHLKFFSAEHCWHPYCTALLLYVQYFYGSCPPKVIGNNWRAPYPGLQNA